MSETEIQEARRRFIGWLRWFMAEYPDRVPSQAAMARLLGLSGAAVHYLFDEDSTRLPSLETVWAAHKLTGYPLDLLLRQDPPKIRK